MGVPDADVGVDPSSGVEGGVAKEGVEPPASISRGSGAHVIDPLRPTFTE